MKIEMHAIDPRTGMTLGELKGFIETCDRSGVPISARISTRITMGGKVKLIAAEGDSTGGRVDVQPSKNRLEPLG